MNRYISSVRIRGSIVRTTIDAESALAARLLLQFLFGEGNLLTPPVLAEGLTRRLPHAEDLFVYGTLDEIAQPVRPRTPQQAQIDALKASKDRAAQALKNAQQRKKVLKAQQTLRTAMSPGSRTARPFESPEEVRLRTTR